MFVRSIIIKKDRVLKKRGCLYKLINGKEVFIEMTTEIEKAANILKLLGDKTRLTFMKLLQVNDCCACEFVEI